MSAGGTRHPGPATGWQRPYRYAIAVGSNLADRQGTICAGAGQLVASGAVALVASSALIETAAVLAGAGGPQPPYLNGAWLVDTHLGAHQLLHLLQQVETALGRIRSVPWGPRTLDLDLLLRDDGLVIASAVLALPHPRLHQRRFVLAPLAEIAPEWMHPIRHASVQALAEALTQGGAAARS